jgi:hypothetical protein
MQVAFGPPHETETNVKSVYVSRRTTVTQHVRPLKGRNRSALVKTTNGGRYVQKVLDAFGDSDLLFNEAFGSRLGSTLGLPFPEWVELVSPEAYVTPWQHSRNRPLSFFGSELVSGDLFEYLPGGWYRNVQNRMEVYKCLLFDLWCNHTDSRQTLFQDRGSRSFHLYFIDHDQLFSNEKRDSLQERIAQSRYLDLRLYNQPVEAVELALSSFVDKIEALVRNDIEMILSDVPRYWGSPGHRHDVLIALRRRSDLLRAYLSGILQFARQTRDRNQTWEENQVPCSS